ncbi:MAG: nickel pincer cofactor biosynthesis protein LarB [Proteobacteria bacterium]|nr:nickel pincer cofactor biosynthesis protein LarB [Pseudomonadota bacterium]MBU1059697.1 nickel pincer cofactor biosynthesis protein LarB [Pseudomonadota bacterium]
MNQETIEKLLSRVQQGTCSVEQALHQLRHLPGQRIKDACIDHHRNLRTGIPEVVYGAGKSSAQIIDIARTFLQHQSLFLATRIDRKKAELVMSALPQLCHHPQARMLTGNQQSIDPGRTRGTIAILCAGTSDIPVAEEARITAESLGNPVATHYDVGVAGLHRLFNKQELLTSASVIIVVAGMEGALPSVVSGLCSSPVVAVPTSVGYGTSFAGIAALLGMLNSCAPGLGVVNIDNGFGAACLASSINRKRENSEEALQDSGSTV